MSPRKRTRGRPKKAAADLYVHCRIGLPRHVYRQVCAVAKRQAQPIVVALRWSAVLGDRATWSSCACTVAMGAGEPSVCEEISSPS